MSDVEPTQPRRRRGWLIAGLATGGVLLAAGGLAVGLAVSGVDRTDDAAVSRAFLTRYATGEASVCELATAELRSQLASDGRCRGEATGQQPQVRIQHIKACGDDALAWVQVTPPGQLGKPYASVGMDRVDGQWAVDSLRPMSQPMPVQPAPCASQTSNDGN